MPTDQEIFQLRGDLQDTHDVIRGIIDAIECDGEQHPAQVAETTVLFLEQAARSLTEAIVRLNSKAH